MVRSITVNFTVLLTSALLAGCGERQPSTDIFEAIQRKDHHESEVRSFVVADPTLVHARDESGETPLNMLAGFGRISSIEFLLEHGADVNQSGYAGMTPLASACHSGELQAAKLLLARGADPNLADENGETPLHQIIMWCPDEFELFTLVVEAGGSTDVVTKDGRSMIEFCRDRRKGYEDPDYRGSVQLRQHLLNSYDRLEALIRKSQEIKLTHVARASLEELLRDYRDVLRVRDLALGDKDSVLL